MDSAVFIRQPLRSLKRELGTATRVHERRSEEELMDAYARGDDRAFDGLFDALAPRLLAFFLRTVRDRTLAEDLLQTTFARVHVARASYRPGAPVRPWLFTIAAHVRSDELRRHRRRDSRHDDTEPDELEDPTTLDGPPSLRGAARGELVRWALDRLPESQRVVLHLHRSEGMTFGEIARVLKVNEGAVRIRAFRAYGTLRKLLEPLLARLDREGES